MDTATPLGLVVNEVVTNSLKHAFGGGKADAAIDIDFRLEEGEYRLAIQDNGSGFGQGDGLPRPAEGKGVGLGTTLVAALAAQLYACYSFSGDAGCRFEMSFPSTPPTDLAPEESAR